MRTLPTARFWLPLGLCAPELREITARLDALEKKTDRQHEETMAAIRQVADYAMVIQRLTKLEAQAQVK
jgi:tetrahydromethanopterin S-methyltransferase subunit G